MEVRDARSEDATALALVHADTWIATYVGRVADALASERVARARNRNWTAHARLRTELGGGVLALTFDGEVVGFCEYGPTEDADDDPRHVGHIMRLYILPSHQGRGGGRLLLDAACSRMTAQGLRTATLWTPEEDWNPACGFYAALGWVREGARHPDGDVRYRLALS